MKAAATFLLSVTVFTTLFLESSTNPLGSTADVDVTNTLTVSLAPIESAIATVASLKAEVRNAVDTAAARIENALNIELLRNTLQEIINECIEASAAGLAVIKNEVDKGLAKSKDAAEREVLTALNDWLGQYESMSKEIHDALHAALASGTSEALESVIPKVHKAIEDTVENVAEQIEVLEATPGKNVSRVKVVVETVFATLLEDANIVVEAMEKVVAAW